ncbi:MAG: hypothetical protein ACRBN8_10110 [Nannocystales bacterium]
MQRRGLLLGLALLGACGSPPQFEAWPKPNADVSPATHVVSLHADLPQQVFTSTYGAQRNSCEGFRVVVDKSGRPRHRRIRKPWTKADRDRFRLLVTMVAREMGAEPRLLHAWSMRESTYQPSALHVLNPDVNGATQAWRKYAYDADEEVELETALAQTDATDPRYWKLKGKLARLRRFKGNQHLYAEVQYDRITPDGTVTEARGSAWAFGYGPFGFNPAYFVQVWDSKAPPWIFCHDDGIPAIVTAIWSARAHQRECEAAGIGGSYNVLNRRLGRGHCAQPDPQTGFIARLGRLGLDANQRARLGKKHPADNTDRAELLELLRSRARAQGLLSPHAQDPA